MIEQQTKLIEQELEEKFRDRIIQNGNLAESYKRLGYKKKAQKVTECGDDLWWRTFSQPDIAPKLYRANFCKDRLCPMCGWRRTKKIFGQLTKIMDRLDEEYEFVFVTLTVQNCSSDELRDYINKLFKSFNLFCHYKEVKQPFKGYFRTLEITRHEHRIRSIEWHPHFHVIFAVKPSYFKSRYYMSHEKLMHLWQRAFDTGYDPWVRIEKVKPKENEHRKTEDSNLDAIHELAKYVAKSKDYITENAQDTDRGVFTLMSSLSAHRLCGLGGVFRDMARQLKLDDMTDGDLVNTDGEELREDLAEMLIRYQWRAGIGYQQTAITKFQKRDPDAEVVEEQAWLEHIKQLRGEA